jgi:hypothetical protein
MVDDGSPLAWSSFVVVYGGAPRSTIVQKLAVPHFVLWTSLEDESAGDATERLTGTGLFGDKSPRLPVGVVPLVKRAGSSGSAGHAGMITFGRGSECDVVLRHPGISKVHAYVRRLGEMWIVTDAGSTNGTKVDGTKLTNVGVELRSGSQMILGRRVALELFWPADLCERFALGR